MTTPVGPPPTGPAPIDPDERPREVETAFRLFVADIVLGVLGLLSMLAFLPRLTRAVEQQQRVSGAAGGVDPVSLATVVVTVFVGVGLGLAALGEPDQRLVVYWAADALSQDALDRLVV